MKDERGFNGCHGFSRMDFSKKSYPRESVISVFIRVPSLGLYRTTVSMRADMPAGESMRRR
jgi:hypothetical protein